ncbi:MAG: hypothetical protein SOZ13_12895 [Enterococcus avium]|uniref:Uncharacterized protein n=1 Tax=Enterococcus avium TaxID=33945 RepID=A0ABD5F699_ENTAV|nr:hypothetical protein [Enterococcus avium]MDT2472436.1 hypothetical protein [Enterococcus avium]MDT2472448.1 hypothetical protein [Enterococcus avium]MDT2513532.1 hypothetical protein [Enterococcus avium]MDT2513544.1 hypothetical protein [Enterococcus avium]MDY4025972.1 hypothetical protein [Enterococcus avium]
MFTHYEYLTVVECTITKVPKTDRLNQSLLLKIPRTDTIFRITVANRIRLPQLKKNDKIKLVLDFYTCGRSNAPRFTVRDVILLQELNVKEIAVS